MHTPGFRSILNKTLTIVLALLLVCGQSPELFAGQAAASGQTGGLRLTIVEGEGAVHNLRLRDERQVILDVTDANGRPVPGAVIGFLVPASGPGGNFSNGLNALSVVTDAAGRAIASFTPNTVAGRFQIIITASFQGQSATARVTQSIVAGDASGASPPPSPSPNSTWNEYRWRRGIFRIDYRAHPRGRGRSRRPGRRGGRRKKSLQDRLGLQILDLRRAALVNRRSGLD